MSLTNNLQTIFNSSAPNTAKQNFPYFELAHVYDALINTDEINKHNAVLILQNNLWFQYLSATYKQENNVLVEKRKLKDEENISVKNNVIQNNSSEAQVEKLEIESLESLSNELVEIKNLETDFEATQSLEVLESSLNDNLNQNTIIESTDETSNPISKVLDVGNLKGILDDIKNKESKTAIKEREEIFEPLYTNDYFESQGVKTSAAPVDRLTVQVRSFTQWLKTMKKIEALPTKLETVEEVIIHHNVINMAENSVKNNQVYTETMVDVLINQGRTNAAIDLLQKLSLQDPNKSRYFAAQIEKLKKQ